MTDDDFSKALGDAEVMFDAFRQMSETLNGAVRTLITEGWSEEHARDLVVAAFVANSREKK